MRKREPWFKFFPSDWQGDAKLRFCSAAARGVWMELLCLMHNSQPYGHLLVNGRLPNSAQLAVLCGVPLEDFEKAVLELENAGVIARTSAGVMFSRRMVRDRQRSEVNAKKGRKGGLAKARAARGSATQLASQSASESASESASDSALAEPLAHIPYSRSQKDHSPPTPSLWPPAAAKAAFDRVYRAYPNGDRRNAAWDVWLDAVRSEQEAQAILDHIERKKAAGWVRLERRFIPTLAKYLEERRWEDAEPEGEEVPWANLGGAWECRECGEVHEGNAAQYRAKACLKAVAS